MEQKRINLCGEVCPVPLMIIQQELANMATGDTLIVDIDMGQTVRNILRWCEKNNYVSEIDETEDGAWLITITK